MRPATVTAVARAVRAGVVAATGVPLPVAAYVVAQLAEEARGLVVITPDDAAARTLADDLSLFINADTAARVVPIAATGTSAYASVSPDRRTVMDRLAALARLAAPADLATAPHTTPGEHSARARTHRTIAIASIPSLMRRTIPRPQLAALSTTLAAGRDIDRDATLDLLVRAGYRRVPLVEDPGTFAVRGGILDVFSPLHAFPARIELLGDTIDTLRTFDPATQRSLRPHAHVVIHPVRETIPTPGGHLRARLRAAADATAAPSSHTRRVIERLEAGDEFVASESLTPAFHTHMASLADYLSTDPTTPWLVFDPDAALRAATNEWAQAQAGYHDCVTHHRLAFPPNDHYLSLDDTRALLTRASRRADLYPTPHIARPLASTTPAHHTESLHLDLAASTNDSLRTAMTRARQQRTTEPVTPLVSAIQAWRADGWRIAITSDSARRRRQLAGMLAGHDLLPLVHEDSTLTPAALPPDGTPVLIPGRVSEGFTLPGDRLALLTEDDIFGRRARTTADQRSAARRARNALTGAVADFAQLTPGDPVVHELHGIGRYEGTVKLPLAGHPIDFLHLSYVGGTLYLPVYRLNEVHRYVGTGDAAPRLDRLGGHSWTRARAKVRQDVEALAEQLLQLYAQRRAQPGHAFPAGGVMYDEFAATFEFEETPDQQRAIDDVYHDMMQPHPMDRLVCGDVGYGKTEVALRAALHAVLGNRQVAVLAPTTVLVEQHYLSFRRRYAHWPVEVAKLSRLSSRAHQRAVVAKLATGGVDIVVGTHRLLSSDIRFRALGLIIVDEEQRFGVKHKERLRKLKTQTDTLTLTATPIPRTLHMAMIGLREISIIATPPADRRAIRTFVAPPTDDILREGIRRELDRGGQVFFICHRIGADGDRTRPGITAWQERLARIVPDARIAAAHGRLDATTLERIMLGFIDHRHDILICTTIVENGIDIPRANTMFIDHADAFGLSQLYQLRGRIGRSSQRAYCYLLVPPDDQLTDNARQRLDTLRRFSQLGSGFEIASRDLAIRGAGDLLGARQSGMISSVGFEQYTTILEQAVAELRGEPLARARDPILDVELPGYIPDGYVPDTGQRLDLYRRLSTAPDEDDIQLTLAEIRDRYGPPPAPVVLLAELMSLKVHARQLHATTVDLSSARLSLTLADDTPLAADHVARLVTAPATRYRLTRDMRLQRTFDATERAQPVATARRCLLELREHAKQSRDVES